MLRDWKAGLIIALPLMFNLFISNPQPSDAAQIE
jgi:hypothetical protein